MPIYTDQTIAGNYDPGSSALPFNAVITTMEINDADGDGFIRADGLDQINGSNVTNVWVGDTITLDGVLITGVTFYTADGGRFFTPSDGSVLTDGTITAQTFVTTSTQFPVGDLGPPCFVAGTAIRVPGGEVPVEELKTGDLVMTRDHGARPIRWIGQRTVPGRGALSPVHIRAGTLGDHGALSVSPQHRVLLDDWRAQLFLGEPEALCAAGLLVNGDTITRAPCATVTYVHFMFEDHEIVYANGLASESFLFGRHLCREGSDLHDELVALFPELGGKGAFMPAARPILRGHEGQLMRRVLAGTAPLAA